MILMVDLHAQFLEFKEKLFDFNLMWIATRVRKLFVLLTR